MVVVPSEYTIMMKPSARLFASLYLLASCSNHTHDIPESPRLAEAVLKRLYTIARLEKIGTLFFVTPYAQHNLLPRVAALMPVLKHDHIRLAVARAYETATMQPLHKLWQELCAYRFLGDELFVEEFSRILYTLLTHPKGERAPNSLSIAEQKLDVLAITHRFYLIQRLRHAVAVCCAAHDKADPALTVMLALWADIQQYKNIDTINACFGICYSIIGLLEVEDGRHNADHQTLAADHAAVEKLLTFIDALVDRGNLLSERCCASY